MSDDKKYSKEFLGKTVVSKSGKRFGEVGDLTFEVKTGEIIQVILKNPTGYCEGLELAKNDRGQFLIPFSSVIASGDFLVIAEEDIL